MTVTEKKKKRITIKTKEQNKNKTAKSAQLLFIGKKYSIVTTNLTVKKNRKGQKTSLWS